MYKTKLHTSFWRHGLTNMKLQHFKRVEYTNTSQWELTWLSLVKVFSNPCSKQHHESNQIIKSKINAGMMGGQFSETEGLTDLLCSVWWDYHQQEQNGVCLAACSVFCIAHHISSWQCNGWRKGI